MFKWMYLTTGAQIFLCSKDYFEAHSAIMIMHIYLKMMLVANWSLFSGTVTYYNPLTLSWEVRLASEKLLSLRSGASAIIFCLDHTTHDHCTCTSHTHTHTHKLARGERSPLVWWLTAGRAYRMQADYQPPTSSQCCMYSRGHELFRAKIS